MAFSQTAAEEFHNHFFHCFYLFLAFRRFLCATKHGATLSICATLSHIPTPAHAALTCRLQIVYHMTELHVIPRPVNIQ